MTPRLEILKPNLTKVEVDGTTYWFSYNTLVAFKAEGGGMYVRRNDWGGTTGKHLTLIDGGGRSSVALRVDRTDFEAALARREAVRGFVSRREA
jgi:hypothetical protein